MIVDSDDEINGGPSKTATPQENNPTFSNNGQIRRGRTSEKIKRRTSGGKISKKTLSKSDPAEEKLFTATVASNSKNKIYRHTSLNDLSTVVQESKEVNNILELSDKEHHFSTESDIMKNEKTVILNRKSESILQKPRTINVSSYSNPKSTTYIANSTFETLETKSSLNTDSGSDSDHTPGSKQKKAVSHYHPYRVHSATDGSTNASRPKKNNSESMLDQVSNMSLNDNDADDPDKKSSSPRPLSPGELIPIGASLRPVNDKSLATISSNISKASKSMNQNNIPLDALLPYILASTQNLIAGNDFRLLESENEHERIEKLLRSHGLLLYAFNQTRDITPPYGSGMKWMDTSKDMYGLRECRQILIRNILVPVEAPHLFADESRSPSHFMYFSGVDGSGFRLLVANFCRENNFNFISIRDVKLFDSGMYTALITYAVKFKPVVVLIDRIDHHWLPSEFPTKGNELISQWHCYRHQYDLERLEILNSQHANKTNFIAPFPHIWFVITSRNEFYSNHGCLQNLINSVNCAWADSLTEDQYLMVMRNTTQKCLINIGLKNDLPQTNLMTLDRDEFIAQLNKSTIFIALEMYQPLFKECIKTLMIQQQEIRNNEQAKPLLSPGQIANFIDSAFHYSFLRYISDAHNVTANDPVKQLPTIKDFMKSGETSLRPYHLKIDAACLAELASKIPSMQNMYQRLQSNEENNNSNFFGS